MSGQFTSWAFSELIRTKHLVGSMGTIGACYDNAPMESFWGSMQIELLNRKKWRTKIELSIPIAEWIEHFSGDITVPFRSLAGTSPSVA